MGVRLATDSGYMDAVLVPGVWHTRQLGWCGFAQDGCRLLGTVGCVSCSQAALIPREDCDPPADCRACPERARCPCGCEALGIVGRWELVEVVLRGAVALGVTGAREAVVAARELMRLVKGDEDGGEERGPRGRDDPAPTS